jgi:hypothetical protein
MLKRIVRLVPAALAVVIVSNVDISALSNMSVSSKIGSAIAGNVFEQTVSDQKQTMYVMSDTQVLQDTSTVSSSVETAAKGSTVEVIGTDGSLCKVLTTSGNTGYVSVSKLTDNQKYIFTDADTTMYAAADIELKKLPDDSSTTVSTLQTDDEVHIVGTNDSQYDQVEMDGAVYYVNKDQLSDTKTQTAAPAVVTTVTAAAADTDTASASSASLWTGQKLTRSAGTVVGPSGKETYYNLNMSGVVSIMKASGYDYEYWERADGVKMYGDYIMVAANLSTRPRGTIIETSLGTAMVCDTGSFVYGNPNQIDVAADW